MIYEGDCLDVLPSLATGSVDAVFCDPPYPHIKRPYGYWTEAKWFALMDIVVPECRRVLKPTGSAVFVLQPNSEKFGRMRTWWLRFMLHWAEKWGIVQDAYWQNPVSLPQACSIQGRLMRPCIKTCAWFGEPNCYRDQDAVLAPISKRHLSLIAKYKGQDSSPYRCSPSGHKVNEARAAKAAVRRGGVSPLNIVTTNHGAGQKSAGAHGHGAGTPLNLCRWWVRYICPPGGTVLDPFAGSGTTGIACEQEGRRYTLIERDSSYCKIIRSRLVTRNDE